MPRKKTKSGSLRIRFDKKGRITGFTATGPAADAIYRQMEKEIEAKKPTTLQGITTCHCKQQPAHERGSPGCFFEKNPLRDQPISPTNPEH